MAIFKNQFHYDNSLAYIDAEWSTDVDLELNVRFAHGPFLMDYHGLQPAFVKRFKEDFTAFYEKVMKDYDEVTGRSNTFEDCFDAMVEGMTEIDYKPTPRYIQIDFDPWWDSESVKAIMNDTITMMERLQHEQS